MPGNAKYSHPEPSLRAMAATPRYFVFTVSCAVALVLLGLFVLRPAALNWLLAPFLLALALVALGVHDLVQSRHAILRNYPIIGHLRFFFEEIRPEMRQYFFESEKDGTPFSRDQRALVYQRAKKQLDKRPFGTQLATYAEGYEWINHSIAPKHADPATFRITVGGPDCARPYEASVLNISAMSFGALSANAVRALNEGARLGGFAHDTGEGGVSPYHRQNGGDLVWQIGSGYFGCRTPDGAFSPERFQETAAIAQIKMIELKLSQGAKPGHGGVLPAAKITPEISAIRGVPMGVDCVSPAHHPAFATPTEMMRFIGDLRRLADGKPVGFKLCIGQTHEFLAICKAMLATNIYPDFVVVDGKEGGTGAAPLEFADHVGMPLREGLSFVHNALVGIGARKRIRVGAAGRIVSAFDMATTMALGADWCNAARGFMFTVGCIQAQTCHTGRCPTGVTAQDPLRQRALVVDDKSTRVANFHQGTIAALAELIGAAGLAHPGDLKPEHISRRVTHTSVSTFAEIYPALTPGELLTGTTHARFAVPWQQADAETFDRLV